VGLEAKLKIDFQSQILLTVGRTSSDRSRKCSQDLVPAEGLAKMIHRLSSWFDGIDAVEISLHDFCKLISSDLRDEPLAQSLR
jgi:hypothetical protein